MVVGVALIQIVRHARIENEIHVLFQQAFNVSVCQLCRIANRIRRNGALSLVVSLSGALFGEFHSKAQIREEGIPQWQLVVIVQCHRQANGCLGLFRLAVGERAKRFIFPVNQIRNLVFLRNPCTPFAAVAGNKAFSVREPQNLQIAMCGTAVAVGILCAIGEGV